MPVAVVTTPTLLLLHSLFDAVVRARLDDHDRRLVLLSVIQVPAHRMQQQQQQQQQ